MVSSAAARAEIGLNAAAAKSRQGPRSVSFPHVDMLWPIWHFFDLTPEGRGADRIPQLDY